MAHNGCAVLSKLSRSERRKSEPLEVVRPVAISFSPAQRIRWASPAFPLAGHASSPGSGAALGGRQNGLPHGTAIVVLRFVSLRFVVTSSASC